MLSVENIVPPIGEIKNAIFTLYLNSVSYSRAPHGKIEVLTSNQRLASCIVLPVFEN